MEIAKLCGYRLYDAQFIKIRALARKKKVSEAEALRIMVDAFDLKELPVIKY